MSDPAPEIGRRLKAARLRAGVSQTDLADRLGVTQTAVSYWEAGRRLPGIEQLMALAGILDAPVSEFLPEARDRRPMAATLRAVANQVESAELAQSLESFALEAQKQPPPPVELTVRTVGARDAAEQLLEAAGASSQVPVDVESLARRCGVRVVNFDFGGMVDGLVIRLDDGPAIGLEVQTVRPRRRRFTLAHELGHYLLGHTASFHVDFITEGEPPGYNWRHERAANDFAANLLMPAAAVRAHHAAQPSVHALAEQFDVSLMAMGFRLTGLGLREGPLEGS